MFSGLLLSALVFTHGIASGDARPGSAVLWTRVDRAAELTVEVSTDPSFQRITLSRNVPASAESDFTAKVVVEPLEPGRTYFYRWRGEAVSSDVGTFQTAPRPDVSTGVRFAFSGDSDGSLSGGAPAYNHFEALDAARRENLDFFVYLGDTIYADSAFRAPASTLEQFRDAYKVNRDLPALRDLLRSTSIYAIWDDHEVQNDYQGQTVDLALYAAGRRAFLEYMPLQEFSFPDRKYCAGDPLFRLFHWGKDIDILIPDERSCRSASALAACTPPGGTPDPAPTLPSVFRLAAGLPLSPPPGCLEALADPSRTMLGGFQRLVLKSALLYSKAKFKFVINEVAIQEIYALPYDRWEGYQAERREILSFIRDNNIGNVIFLTADAHANLINKVYVDRFRDPTPVADEFVTGPIATRTLQRDLQETIEIPPGAFSEALELVGVSCANLDAYSYGLVEVDAQAGTATITLKDDQGNVLRSQINPGVACVKTIGP
ncbi:MAG: alkaline phosphatase D family protein [Acidobacteria bacterium]|nr:alkaline phosphatase D family protein [Acidobacteriota bacterium]